jgi:hypothetical protein
MTDRRTVVISSGHRDAPCPTEIEIDQLSVIYAFVKPTLNQQSRCNNCSTATA